MDVSPLSFFSSRGETTLTEAKCPGSKLIKWRNVLYVQGDHLSGKPGNVRQSVSLIAVKEMSRNLVSRELSGKNLVRENVTVHCPHASCHDMRGI